MVVDDVNGRMRSRRKNERLIVAWPCRDVHETLRAGAVQGAHRSRSQGYAEPVGNGLVRAESRRRTPGEDGTDHVIGNAAGSS